MSALNETLGTMSYDDLINGAYPPADVFSVVLRRGTAATLNRGTVLARSSRDGLYVILGTAEAPAVQEAAATYKDSPDTAVVAGKTYYTRSGDSPNYVYTPVADPVDANIATYYEIDTPAVAAQDAEVLTANCILADVATIASDAEVVAVAYRLGHFNRNKIIVKSGYTFTADDEEDLRKAGIILSDAVAM
jgi:hypothetical protein